MEEADKDRINQIIEECQKDSEYFKRLKEKKSGIDIQIKEHKDTIAAAKTDEIFLKNMTNEFNGVINAIIEEIDRSRYWAHFDIDMFYAAIEIRDNPQLANKPIGVGTGVVSTCNYIARKFGVRSAMPTFIAKKLCPDITMVPDNHQKYSEASKIFMSVLLKYDSD